MYLLHLPILTIRKLIIYSIDYIGTYKAGPTFCIQLYRIHLDKKNQDTRDLHLHIGR